MSEDTVHILVIFNWKGLC